MKNIFTKIIPIPNGNDVFINYTGIKHLPKFYISYLVTSHLSFHKGATQ